MTDSGIIEGFYDIAILPPPGVRDHAIKLSAMLQPFGSPIRLGEESFMPHVSLYHIPVRRERIPDFVDKLRKAMKNYEHGRLNLSGITVRTLHRAFFLDVAKTPWLQVACDDVRAATYFPFYDWENEAVGKFWEGLGMNAEMRQNYHDCGSPMLGKYFYPHFTLGFVENDESMYAAAAWLRQQFHLPEEEPTQDVRRILKEQGDIKLLGWTLSEEQAVLDVDRLFILKVGRGGSAQGVVEEITF